MSKKKAIVISIILGVIALLEIGGAVTLLFYSNEIRQEAARLTPTPTPTNKATKTPTKAPKKTPTVTPTLAPTKAATKTPTSSPTLTPTKAPTKTPTSSPTLAPTKAATKTPTSSPTLAPTKAATKTPTVTPTLAPTKTPTKTPTSSPTKTPTRTPTPTPILLGEGVVAPSSNGRLHVEGYSIVDEKGKAVQLKGISTAGLQWFPQYVDRTAFHEFRYEWGVNIIRLALYTGEGGYCSGGNKANLKDLVEKGVEYATAEDMYVIIDWHILSDNDPNKYKAEALVFFEEMSAKYKGYNNVIYEICNEPNGGTTWSQIKSYATEVIKVIRKNDPNAIIIVGTPTWSQEVDKAAADPIKGYENIMYTLHFYAGTHKDSLRNTMENALKKGLPIFVTEYGITDASGDGACNETEANKWMELLNKYGVSSCIWNLANKNESSCLLLSSCKKTNGFTLSDLTQEGKWFYGMITAGNRGMVAEESNPPDAGNNSGGDNGSENNGSNSGGNNSAAGNSGSPNETVGTEYVITQGNLQITLKVTGAWGGSQCKYQYAVSIKNTGTTAVTGWSVTIPFTSEISSGNFWCCKLKAEGKTITISNESWNGNIAAGQTISDIGVEILGNENLKPVK